MQFAKREREREKERRGKKNKRRERERNKEKEMNVFNCLLNAFRFSLMYLPWLRKTIIFYFIDRNTCNKHVFTLMWNFGMNRDSGDDFKDASVGRSSGVNARWRFEEPTYS